MERPPLKLRTSRASAFAALLGTLVAGPLLGLSGCAAPPPPSFGPAPGGAPARALLVAPLPRDYTPTLEEPLDEQGRAPTFSPPFRIALDPGPLQGELVSALAQRGGFERVDALGSPSSSTHAERLGAARDQGAELLLEMSLVDAEVRLVETNGWHGVKVGVLIVSSILIFPAVDPFNWFIPGEDYGVTLHASWELTLVRSGARLARGYLQSSASDSFAAFGPGPTRPWYVIGFLRTPGCIDPEEWQEIGSQLLDRARAQLLVDLTHAVEGARHPTPTPGGGQRAGRSR